MKTASLITLPGGLTLPVALIDLLWDFERRGIAVGLNAEGGLAIGSDAPVTDADRARLQQWTPLIRALGAVRVLVQ